MHACFGFLFEGDHQQLAACVKSPAAQQRGLDVTLFGRLIEKHPQAAALLSIQYRSNEAAAADHGIRGI